MAKIKQEIKREIFSYFSKENPNKILFDHLPKCGGSSLNKYLEMHYPRRRTFSIDGYHPEVSVEKFKNLSKKISVKNIVVTSGISGAALVNCKNNSVIFCPAFSQNSIDTVGAGDTFFGMSSLSIGAKIDNKISMLIASISASFAINQLGKKSYFNEKDLKKHLTHIFK